MDELKISCQSRKFRDWKWQLNKRTRHFRSTTKQREHPNSDNDDDEAFVQPISGEGRHWLMGEHNVHEVDHHRSATSASVFHRQEINEFRNSNPILIMYLDCKEGDRNRHSPFASTLSASMSTWSSVVSPGRRLRWPIRLRLPPRWPTSTWQQNFPHDFRRVGLSHDGFHASFLRIVKNPFFVVVVVVVVVLVLLLLLLLLLNWIELNWI